MMYRDLLRDSRTRWLSLHPAINRLLQMYPALKSYFLSLDSCPVAIERFFESQFSEAYLLFVHSLTFLLEEKIRKMEKETNSILEVVEILSSLKETLLHKKKEDLCHFL